MNEYLLGLDQQRLELNKNDFRNKYWEWVSRTVYNPRFFDICGTLALTLAAVNLYGLDRSPETVDFLQGRIVDAVGTGAHAALTTAYMGDMAIGLTEAFESTRFSKYGQKIDNYFNKRRSYLPSLIAFIGQSYVWELGQRDGLIPGTYDPGDFVAYGVGAAAWVAISEVKRKIGSRKTLAPVLN